MFVCGDSAGGNITHHVKTVMFRGGQGHGFFIFDPECESRENSPQDYGGARGGGLVDTRWGGDRQRREEEEEKGRLFDEEEEEGIDLRQALAHIYQGDLLLVPATSRE